MRRLALKAPWVVFVSFSEPKGRDKSPCEDTSSFLGEVIPLRVPFPVHSMLSLGPSTAHLSAVIRVSIRKDIFIHLSLQDTCSQPYCKDLPGKELRFLQDLYPLPFVRPTPWLILSTAWETGERTVPHILSIPRAVWGWGWGELWQVDLPKTH